MKRLLLSLLWCLAMLVAVPAGAAGGVGAAGAANVTTAGDSAAPVRLAAVKASEWDYQAYRSEVSEQEAAARQSQTAQSDLLNRYDADRQSERTFFHNLFIIISITTVVLALVAILVLFKIEERPRAQDVAHVISLALIVYAVLILALFPVSEKGRLDAPIGMLGTLAGYIFGHATSRNAARKEVERKDPDRKPGS